MADFKRQPSKVWWSNYPEEDDSRISNYLDWGNGVDLSGTFTEEIKNNRTINSEIRIINHINASKTEMDQSKTDMNKSQVNAIEEQGRGEYEDPQRQWEGPKLDSNWENSDLTGNRGSSSSPSQGSHKSQDSGFSDSEIQLNAVSNSPQDSPDLSKRLECNKCSEEAVTIKHESTNINQILEDGKSDQANQTVINYQKLKTSIKKFSYHVVEFKDECFNNDDDKSSNGSSNNTNNNDNNNNTTNPKFLETAFDELSTDEKLTDESGSNRVVNITSSPKQSKRRNLIKTHISRTKNDNHEKINQIQNQLELSFKLPKKSNLTQNLKMSNLIITQFQARPHETSQNSRISEQAPTKSKGSEEDSEKEQNTGSVKSLASSNCDRTVIEIPKKNLVSDSSVELDSEGFKIPKKLSEQNVNCKGSNNFLDLTDIEGPPISCSTPKSSKMQRQESPIPKAARATEKTVGSMSTFATIRKLKGLSEKKMKGPINLLSSFNRCGSKGSLTKKKKPSTDTESAVKQWLFELETSYEAEIMTTLQSKSLATDLTRQVTNMAATTSQTVRKLHQRTKTISNEFSKLCQNMKCKKYKQIGPLVQSLIGHIKEFVTDYVQNRVIMPESPETTTKTKQSSETVNKSEETTLTPHQCQEMITDFRQIEPETKEVIGGVDNDKSKTTEKSKDEEVLEACEQLRQLTMDKILDQEAVDELISHLGRKFTEVVDVILISHIKALVHVLEEPRTELALRTALSALTTLSLEGNHLSHLVSRCGGVRALLAVCLEARATAVRVSALRALATMCCIAETIRQFEQAGGVEIISDLLSDETRSEPELSEAAAVLAQITAPWVQDNHSVEGLSRYLNSLVSSLTRIVKEYKSGETLLLAAAALANLTFMEPRTVWPLLEHQTAGILLSAVRQQGPKVSVFIQEQAATVIANMASIPECRKHLAENRAVVALLCFLQIRHSPLQRAPEISAAERVQQKSAIALSRLCSDSTVAKQVIELQGVNRLVRLCKEERERNHSDGVLVACLAALRKIVANCGTEALEELNAMELVEPRLLDSFLLYSSRQESYV